MQNIKEILKIICALYVFFLCLQVFCTHTIMHKFRSRVEFQIYAIELEHHALTHVICRENIISSKNINTEVHILKQMKYLGSKMKYFKVQNFYLGFFCVLLMLLCMNLSLFLHVLHDYYGHFDLHKFHFLFSVHLTGRRSSLQFNGCNKIIHVAYQNLRVCCGVCAGPCLVPDVGCEHVHKLN